MVVSHHSSHFRPSAIIACQERGVGSILWRTVVNKNWMIRGKHSIQSLDGLFSNGREMRVRYLFPRSGSLGASLKRYRTLFSRHRLASDRRVIGLLSLVLLVMLVGCDIPARPPLKPEDLESMGVITGRGTQPADPSDVEVYEATDMQFDKDWETWDAYFVNNRQVGWNHVVAEVIRDSDVENLFGSDPEDGDRKVRYRLENVLYVRQGNALTRQRVDQTSTESSTGRLLNFDSTLTVGPVVTRYVGRFDKGKLMVETIRGSVRSTKAVSWDASCRGLVAIEQSLRANPLLDKGDGRTLRILLPGEYELASARLRCSGLASVPLMDGSMAELIEINYEIQIDNRAPTFSTIWTDKSGAIVRTFSPDQKMLSYRTDEATVKAGMQKSGIPDSGDPVAVSVAGSIERSEEAIRLALELSTSKAAADSGVSLEFDPAPGQWLRDKSDQTLQVLISRIESGKPPNGFRSFALEPGDGDSNPTYFITSGDPLVRRFAGAAVGTGDLSNREAALALTRTTNQLIEKSPAPTGLVSASDVVRDAMADSTGQSILLAAMLRSRGIPARIAIGLKYEPSDPKRMVYRAWTMAHVDGTWMHLDAIDGGEAAADRLILSHTDLASRDEYRAFIPFLESIGRIRIELLRAEFPKG